MKEKQFFKQGMDSAGFYKIVHIFSKLFPRKTKSCTY